jgi:transcriptional regulator with XRE-family HTH domain
MPRPDPKPAEGSAAVLQARYRTLIERIESSPEYGVDVAMLQFTDELNRSMVAQGISRAELARRIGASPAYVTKIMRGDANLTLASMVKLAGAVGQWIRVRFETAPARGKQERAHTEGRRAASGAKRRALDAKPLG